MESIDKFDLAILKELQADGRLTNAELAQRVGLSAAPCWRRVRAWQKAGVWRKLHRVLLDKLRGADKLDFSRVVADSSSLRAVHGGKKLDRTQPIAVRQAASTTSSSMRKASRSSRRPTRCKFPAPRSGTLSPAQSPTI